MKPVCGKNGKTYNNECLAKCAGVLVNSHKACSTNTEAMSVWQAFKNVKAEWLNKWQKNWDAGARNPTYGVTTKITVSNTKTEYAFKFANKCVANIVFEISSKAFVLVGAKCPTTECVDSTELPGLLVSTLKTTPKFVTFLFSVTLHIMCSHTPFAHVLQCISHVSTYNCHICSCASVYKTVVGDYGFKCDQSLVELINLDVTRWHNTAVQRARKSKKRHVAQ